MSKTYTAEELAEILDKHGRWLRGKEGGKKANLAGANLYGANLAGTNLARANLARTNLYGANLAGATFSGANLYGANLAGTNLARANLSEANLYGANFYGATLYGANLAEATLARANLSEANLYGATLARANLYEANLYGANFYGATFSGANLDYWILPEEGAFTAWKSVRSTIDRRPVILKLSVADGTARACNYVSRKCRVAACVPVAAFEKTGEPCAETEFVSNHDSRFVYRIGEESSAPELDADPRVECGAGLHIWITRKEAEGWL